MADQNAVKFMHRDEDEDTNYDKRMKIIKEEMRIFRRVFKVAVIQITK